jgi:phospholipid transport system substrate-binding protein
MPMRLLSILSLAFAIAVSAVPAAKATASDPAAHQIENFYSTLLETMKHGSELGMHGRYQSMAPAVDATFDIPTMMQFIVGPNWTSMSDGDRKSLIDAFRRMTIANYASNFDSFHGQHFDVDANVQTKGSDRFVQSTLVLTTDKPIPFVYRMRDTGAGWKAIDIYLNGYVSELATRRSDFSATLASGGASALVKKLNSLADNLLAGVKVKTGQM